MIHSGSPLAPTRLARLCAPAAVLFLMSLGCLMPQSVDPATTRPHIIPRVDLKNLRDYELKPTMLLYPRGPSDPTSCQCVLNIEIPAIIADDPTVDVEGRFFVDYDVAVPSSQRRIDAFILPGDFQSSATTRVPPALVIDADRFGLSDGVHVFELVLAEREGFAADAVFPPQRATKPDWESSVFKFVVNLQRHPPDEAQRPTCDVLASPPQVRICSP
jgi:hypothetical protein